MAIIRPRLNDYYDIPILQEEVDFAIPSLDEDIPLYVDPFLLWAMPSMQDNGLHSLLVEQFNQLGHQYLHGKEKESVSILSELSECNEVGLGNSKTRVGKKIGSKLSAEVLNLFKDIPQLTAQGFTHFEEVQLLVDNISKDRISDISCSLLKSFLIDFTIEQCEKWAIPMTKCSVPLFDYKKFKFQEDEAWLPINPNTNRSIILTPKRWLRFVPWINYEDYFQHYFIENIQKVYDGKLNRVPILSYNRQNYNILQSYINIKEIGGKNIESDPLFKQIPVMSVNRKLCSIKKLPSGKIDNADQKYEDYMAQMLASLLYPHLDFAQEQSRTESGLQIRDMVFYNNRSVDFLQDIYNDYSCKQIVVEFKNVASVEKEHINQLNRYLSDSFGRFGIIFTRNRPNKNIMQHTIDLWSGHRKCILIMDDTDLEMMCNVYESKQRLPIEVIKKKFIEFTQKCPS